MLKRSILLLSLCLAYSFCSPPSFCAENFLKLGVAEFNKGNYADAAGMFGGALTTDFNNSTLHYYMGMCYSHLKQKDSAIREFRIAYALDPEKEVGTYSKQALASFGLDTTGAIDPKKTATGLPLSGLPGTGSVPLGLNPNGGTAPPFTSGSPPGAPSVGAPSKSSMLDRQASDLQQLRQDEGKLSGQQAEKQGSAMADRMKNDLMDSLRYRTRYGGTVQMPLSVNDKSQIEFLRQSYNSQRDAYLQNSSHQSSEIQRTADALRDQMNEEAKAGKVHLSPSGTNLYVRSYEMTPSTTSSSTTPKTSAKTSTPVPSAQSNSK